MDVITIYLSKLIKLYILNMHDLLYVNYTSVELKVYFLKKKKKNQLQQSQGELVKPNTHA